MNEEREMFALIREHGGDFKTDDAFGRLTLDGDDIMFHRPHWPSLAGLADLIQRVKRHVLLPWIVRLEPDVAREVWTCVTLAEHAAIRANRPADVGPGWMFSLCGVDVYERSGRAEAS